MEVNFLNYLYLIIALILAISVHEFSHAFVAYILGDPTSKLEGRVTLNPIKHLDPIGSLMIFITFFAGVGIGWGKPVPINPYNFKNYKAGEALTALAGPMSNFAMAFVSAVLLKYFNFILPVFLSDFLGIFIILNIGLMCFNLLPVPPLDGSKVLFLLLPDRYYHYRSVLEQKGPIILFGVIILGQVLNIPTVSLVISPLYQFTFWILGL